MKIAVVRNAGAVQGTIILGGVYGSLSSDESGNNRFKIDPEFNRVSYLFSLLADGQAPVQISDVVEYEVPDSLATTVKANLMHALSQRWDKLYDMGARADSMMGSMLMTERNRVLSATRQYITSMGMSAYQVSYEFDGETAYAGSDLADMESVKKAMVPVGAIRITAITILPSSAIAVRPALPPVNTMGEDLDIDQVRPWHFGGRKVAGTVSASVTVVAMNESAARSMASMVLGISENNLDQQNAENRPQENGAHDAAADNTRSVNSNRDNAIFGALTPTVHAIENMRAGSEIVYQNYDGDDLLEDEGQQEAPRQVG